jgi:hypothetical protein
MRRPTTAQELIARQEELSAARPPPGFRSSRIHVLDVAGDPRRPRVEKVIEAEEPAEKTGYSRPHTVHCMPGGNVVISMLRDRHGNGAAASPCSTRRPST